ncbi:hypothetical protein JTB14_007459 [Gonioctena quinquepunctata]|nr:hypothetical protein JTB14_007459 [Gonioctena quinquepunctata]
MLRKVRKSELLELKWMDIARAPIKSLNLKAHCFAHQRDTPLKEEPSETLNLIYEATTAKEDRLKSLGYDVIDMWECDFKRRLNDNKELQEYVENHPLVLQTPLNPRDAFYGGRTGNTFEYYKAQNDEKIKYIDVCSLYPWVCKYGKFPVGHPKVYVSSECPTLSSVSGLIRCRVLPPIELFHPVLPTEMNNKLMFVLCRVCGQKLSFDDCSHSDKERSSIGTWTVDEVLKAIDKGYEVLEKYEIWAYDTVQFESNPTIYVNTVLPVNEDTLIVNWEYREEACDSLPTVNVVIAASVTAQARLKLYSYLGQLEKRVLYYDTDSVIYVSRPREFDIPNGEFVGDMTDELEKEGLDSYITEFVSGGAKNYSYTLWSTKDREHKTVCKVKGISLNHSASQLINFDVIKDMVLTPCDPIHIVNKQIRRTQEHENLQQRSKWQFKKEIQELTGRLVLLRDDKTLPQQWTLGIINSVHQGSDNIVRVVNILTKNGIVKRTITKISILPVN